MIDIKKMLVIGFLSALLLQSCASYQQVISQQPAKNVLRATGDLGVIIERATGQVKIVNHTHKTQLSEISG